MPTDPDDLTTADITLLRELGIAATSLRPRSVYHMLPDAIATALDDLRDHDQDAPIHPAYFHTLWCRACPDCERQYRIAHHVTHALKRRTR